MTEAWIREADIGEIVAWPWVHDPRERRADRHLLRAQNGPVVAIETDAGTAVLAGLLRTDDHGCEAWARVNPPLVQKKIVAVGRAIGQTLSNHGAHFGSGEVSCLIAIPSRAPVRLIDGAPNGGCQGKAERFARFLGFRPTGEVLRSPRLDLAFERFIWHERHR